MVKVVVAYSIPKAHSDQQPPQQVLTDPAGTIILPFFPFAAA